MIFKKKIVWKTSVQSRNFVSDFGAKLKNIIGGKLKPYILMVDLAIEEATNNLYSEYPDVTDVKLQISELSNSAVLVTAYGVIEK